MSLPQALLDTIAHHLGIAPTAIDARPVHGGDIAQSFHLSAPNTQAFLKLMLAGQVDVLGQEAAGLEALQSAGAVRVPKVFAPGADGESAWLLLEYLELVRRDESADAQLGLQLAVLHAETGPYFGWKQDNYLGRTQQHNAPSDNWAEFFREQRLRPQLQAIQTATPGALPDTDIILAASDRLLASHAPAPSLLHGDLWSGNAAALADGTPVIYDPAVHYGDGECDLAMMRLFGGFAAACFEAYGQASPLPDGHEQRLPLYQLYHVLNHVNLFGTGYLAQAQSLLRNIGVPP